MKKSKYKLSISIVTYNHQNLIRECLQSVVEQECDFDFEVVVGDDYSTDNTRSILMQFAEKYPNMITLLFQKSNVGYDKNLQDVINICTGEYIANIDGDDGAFPLKFKKQLDFLEKHRDCSMCFHNLRLIIDGSKGKHYNNPLDENTSVVNINEFVNQGLAHWGNASKMYRRSALPKEGFKSFDCIPDQHFHLQIARNGKVAYLNEVLGFYRKHSQGVSVINRNKDKIKCALNDLVRTYRYAKDYGVEKEIVDRRISFVYYDAACQYLMLNDYTKFKHYITKSNENFIFFNTKHRICFILKELPRLLFFLKILNNYVYRVRGKQVI